MAATSILVNGAENSLRDLKLLIAKRDDQSAAFEVADHASALAGFLAVSARSLAKEPGSGREQCSDEFRQARDDFIQAGLEALAVRPHQASNDWLQIGIHPQDGLESGSELCRRVACLARRLLNDSAVDDFFFMNKPPGMRLRFRIAAAGSRADLAGVLQSEVTRWLAEELIDHVEPGVYEPECQLFGGPRSMDFVHALFTIDSLIWLDYHACRAVEGEAAGPAWLVSLTELRTVFAGLDITGWEDIGVWDRIREMAGRRLEGDKASLPMYAEVSGQIRDVWSRLDPVVDGLHPEVKATLDRHDSALLEGARRWRSGYFRQPMASLGPRAAAAFYVIFHWNRAALSRTEQALLAESLSERVFANVRG
jgi:thiopeptide-type bacteriocin biosynthesis protein